MNVHFDEMIDDVESMTKTQFMGAKLNIKTLGFDGWVDG